MRQLHIRHFLKKNNCESTITIKLLQLQKRAVIEEMSLEEISADRNRDLSSGPFSSTVTQATLSLVHSALTWPLKLLVTCPESVILHNPP